MTLYYKLAIQLSYILYIMGFIMFEPMCRAPVQTKTWEREAGLASENECRALHNLDPI